MEIFSFGIPFTPKRFHIRIEKEWTRCLAFLPSFNSENLLQQLNTKSASWPTSGNTPKAFGNRHPSLSHSSVQLVPPCL